MLVFSIINQKGGTNKTTIAVNLTAAINRANRDLKLLLIDMDPQANATSIILPQTNYERPDPSQTIFSIFNNKALTDDSIIFDTRFYNFDAIPSSIDLSVKEFEAYGLVDSQRKLMNYLDTVCKDKYDIVIIDCPPSVGIYSLNTLMASDYVIIPAVPEKFAILGIRDLINTITLMMNYNKKLKIFGVLPTQVDRRYKVHKDLLDQQKEALGELFLDDYLISTNAPIKDACNLSQTIFEYQYQAKSARQFRKLAYYLLDRIGLNVKEKE